METTAATNPTEAPGSENIMRIDRELYKAAVEGNFDKFINVHNIESLLTPNKNTILHVHLTSTKPSQSKKPKIPEQILALFRHLVNQKAMVEILSEFLLEPTVRRLFGNAAKTKTASESFVRQILNECADLVLLQNADGETPLHLAARYGHSNLANLLIHCAKDFPPDTESGIIGAEIKLMRAQTHENRDTALHEAVRYHHIEVVEILLEMDPDLSTIANRANETPLYMAAERESELIVSKILEEVEEPAYEGPSGRTALHAAVINGDRGMTIDLLNNEHLRVTVKQADKNGWVPLHYAARLGNKWLTKLLLEEDENTAYMKDNEGRTALHMAAYYGDWDVLEMIIEYCPDCSELVDNKGRNALHYAVRGNTYFTVTSILGNLSLSNIYNKKDVDGNTALHLLVKSGNFGSSSIKGSMLMRHSRVELLALNKEYQTVYDVAYATIENPDRVLDEENKKSPQKIDDELQDLLRELGKVGAIRSPRLDIRSKPPGSMLVFSEEAKETHLIVATLIATVTFAAAFTLPGGTIQDGDDKGSPILGHKASFKAFITSNTIAMVSAASAAFIHLVPSLRNAKWMSLYLSDAAFSFILVAAATMMVAFATGMYAMLGSSAISVAIVVTVVVPFFYVSLLVLLKSAGTRLKKYLMSSSSALEIMLSEQQ